MRVLAPGKLVLTGAYAVLEGAPAIVAAVARYAVADAADPDGVDVRALHDDAGRKLGLGSSAASIVASQAARAAALGADLRDRVVRDAIFRTAREAHARAQGGGSGVDVAASVYGGVLRYSLGPREPSVRGAELPGGVVLAAFWSGTSARTSDLRARVDALRADRSRGRGALDRLRAVAGLAASAVNAGDGGAFVGAAREFGRALDALGHAADAPVVPPAFAELASLASCEDAAFLPSGAGGGDVAVWLGRAAPSDAFLARATALAMRPLPVAVDPDGVRTDPS